MAPDERRQAIIDATLPLLLEHGPEISTSQIARAAGVAEGTIFRAFDTKQDLIHATVDAAMEPDAAIARLAALPEGQSLTERVVAILDLLHGEILRTRSVIAHFARPVGPPTPPPPGHLRGAGPHASKARLGRAVAASLTGHAGELSVGTDFAARILMSLSFAASFTLPEEQAVFDATELADFVLHGIARGDS